MEAVSNNNNNNIQLERDCKNGCGKLIKWDKSQNTYIEVDTNDMHRCPNWNPRQEHLVEGANHKITLEQQIYVDTIGPIVLDLHSDVQDIKWILRGILILMRKKTEESDR
jgi:hypothetical protein